MSAREHIIDVTRGAALRTLPPPLGMRYLSACRAVGARMKRTRRRLDIMSTLATGWLPWGRDWRHRGRDHASLMLYGRQYILCCGHVLGAKEAQAFVDAGLLEAGEPDEGAPTLVITEAGRVWLCENWHRQARPPGPMPVDGDDS